VSAREPYRLDQCGPVHPICETLRDVRIDAGITQVELARRTGMKQSMISEMERGTVSPMLVTVDRVATALGMVLVLVPAVDS
jgi:predicted transcriptional regulator